MDRHSKCEMWQMRLDNNNNRPISSRGREKMHSHQRHKMEYRASIRRSKKNKAMITNTYRISPNHWGQLTTLKWLQVIGSMTGIQTFSTFKTTTDFRKTSLRCNINRWSAKDRIGSKTIYLSNQMPLQSSKIFTTIFHQVQEVVANKRLLAKLYLTSRTTWTSGSEATSKMKKMILRLIWVKMNKNRTRYHQEGKVSKLVHLLTRVSWKLTVPKTHLNMTR